MQIDNNNQTPRLNSQIKKSNAQSPSRYIILDNNDSNKNQINNQSTKSNRKN